MQSRDPMHTKHCQLLHRHISQLEMLGFWTLSIN